MTIAITEYSYTAANTEFFELTNTGSTPVDLTGWSFDDNTRISGSFSLSALGVVNAGESVIVTEAVDVNIFRTAWSIPATVKIIVGGPNVLGRADEINIYDNNGLLVDRLTYDDLAIAGSVRTQNVSAWTAAANLGKNDVAKWQLSVVGDAQSSVRSAGNDIGNPGRYVAGPTSIDLSTYTRIGRFDLPEPTRTTAPPNSLLAQEASAITYNKDTDTLFVVGDGSRSIVQISKTGQLIDSMTLALGTSPQGTDFYDLEGLTYVGGGKFAFVEERDRQVSLFTYAPGTTLNRAGVQTVKLGTSIGNVGIEGISYDPQTSGFIAVKESGPAGIFQTAIDFAAGTASNGSPTTVNSTDLFNPALAGLADFADVYALSNLTSLNGRADAGNILVLSQESGKIVEVDRAGNILSSLTITAGAGDIAVPDQQHEGLTIDKDGFLYVVSENGGGDINRPQLWVYGPNASPVANLAPTALALTSPVNSVIENTSTATRIKVADVVITDDGQGTNNLTVSGTDASFFEVDSSGLYVKAGTSLDFETKASYNLSVNVEDATVGGTPDATSTFALAVTDVLIETPPIPSSIFITEVAPWSSGNSTVAADWFELTNTGTSAVDITGWKIDDNSNAFANAATLNGITTIGAGESVIFIEGATTNTNFRPNWFGTNQPAGLQIGSYSGAGLGLSTAGDAVNIYNASGVLQANVVFGASPAAAPFTTFNNAALANNATISTASAVGTNGAVSVTNTLGAIEIGSPGTTTQKYTLQLLHYYGESGLLGVETAPILGALIDRFDDQYSNTLVLGEGDSYIPGPWLVGGSDPSLNTVPGIGTTALGRPDIAIMNAFGTDASALGNHEFDLGSPVLAAAIAASGSGSAAYPGAQFPFITSNLTFAADSSLRGLADATLGGTATNAFAGQEAAAIKGKIAPYTVVTQGGEKIGIVGATTFDLLTKTSPNGTVPKDDGLPTTDDLQEVAAFIQAAVDALRATGINKIVLVDQLDTIERNKLLVPLVSGIDVMIAGGGHERLGDATDTAVGFNGHSADFVGTYPIVSAGADGKPTLIVTTDTEYTYLGRLVVDFDANGEIILPNLNPVINGAYAATQANLQAAYGTTQTTEQIVAGSSIGARVDAITDAINAVIISKDSNIFGFTKVYLEGDRAFGRAQEVNLGDISADANIFKARAALGTGAVIASLKNGGGLRASIGSIGEAGQKLPPAASNVKPVGAISQLDVENALRFDNRLMVFDTTPQGLLNILNYAAGLAPGNGGFAQVGGVQFSYDSTKPVGQRVQDVAISDPDGNLVAKVVDNGLILAGAPSTISVITLSFTANGGDGYPIKANADNFRFLLNNNTLSAPIDEALDFTAAANVPANTLGEQKAFEDFLKAFHATPQTAYNIIDTPAAQDQRIQNLQVKTTDTVFSSLKQDPPVAVNDIAQTGQNNAVVIPVSSLLANDSNKIPAPLNITGVSGAVNGNAVLNNNGTASDATDDFVTFAPATNFLGDASFSYTLSNGDLSSTASVVVAVKPNAGVTPVSDSLISLKKVGGIVSTNGAEIAAFDAGSDRLFVVAGSLVEIQKIDNKGAITANGSLAFGFTPPVGTEVLPNSVAVKNGMVAVAYAVVNTTTRAQQVGQVSFYNAATGAFLKSVEVGFLPDMLTFMPDGTKVLVANEGEPNSYGQATSFDPEGSVSVINIAGGVATATVQNASFASFNSQIAALRTAGVRIFGPGATVAQDLEPEYIAVSPDGLTARVTLQENNAVAILDIATATITSIVPLGVKNHNLAGNGLDASDRDLNGTVGTIKIQNQPVVGLYQPDAIASFSINGQAYYITANEGDARDYTGFAEELRVGAAGYVFDPTLFSNAATLKQNVNLGRLTVTRATGDTDGDGDFDRIEAFGARSFTIWNASGTQVFDSGDQIERITATQVPTLFNSDGAAATLDSRSDNKGPEPEGVAIGVINNRTYAFIGLERVGDVLVYDVSNPASPQFVQYLNTPEDVGVEGLSFISAADSPTGKPLLVTANEISKTTVLFEISLEAGKSVDNPNFLGQQTFATGLIPPGDAGKINGVDVPLGGLSGVTYDAVNNRYYAISDDRSQFGPARFYTFNLDPATLTATGVNFTGVTALKDASGNTFALNSLDPEGIALSGNGTIFVSSEGEARPDLGASRVTNPFIKEFSLTTGQEIRSFTVPTKFLPKIQDTNGDGIVNTGDTQTAGIRNNLAFESLTITPDQQTLYTATENALFQDGATANTTTGSHSRIVQYNVATGLPEKEFIYVTDPVATAPVPATGFNTNGLVDLLAIDNKGTVLALERSFSAGAPGTGNTIKIYELSLQDATDVSAIDSLNSLTPEQLNALKPAQKRLVLDLKDLNLSTGLDNVEGLAFGPKLADGQQSIVLVSDNNFSATQFTQVLSLGTNLITVPDSLPKITNYDFTNLPKLGTATNGQEISLGGFSGLFFQGLAANGNLKFVTNTDRGPNGEPTGANRPFLLPSFQPEIVSFELNRTTGIIDITKRTGLFRADGTTPLTGLPNLRAQANGLAYTDEIGVDLNGTVLANDPFGADLEGIVVAPNGDYWMVDEYRPAIYHFDINGKMLDRFIPRGTAAATEPDSAPGTFGTEVLPEVYAQRRSNRGFEAVALEGDKLYAFIQSPIDNPDNAGDTASRATRTLRILEFNIVSKAVTGEYVYLLDNVSAAGTAKTDKLGDAVALGNGKFALVERDDLGTSASNKLIYQIDLAGATNINNPANFTLPTGKTIEQLTPAELTTARITPVSKNLIANAAQLGYTGVEKLEGLALVAPNTLALINDNDFNVAGGNVPERLGILELAKPLTVAQPAFPNGVASGDTTQNSTVLWTRANTLGNVTFEYSTKADFSLIAGSKTATVTNALQPVKVNVDGLAANTDYFYRVTDANGAKTNGKFSTAAALGTRTGLRFGASGDWRGELSPYPSIGNADTANLKFFVELGDTIYGDVASPAVRNPDGTEKAQATTLADYRAKQAEVYSSRFGQNTLGDLRASTSILATIDDHEVTNDFSGGKSLATANAATQTLFGATTGLQNDSPLFENGLQAFQEYNPLQDLTYNTPSDARTDGERKLYRANTFGSDAATFILDTRSFRDGDLANVTNLADQAQVGKFLVDSFDPTRTFLGKQQLADLKQDLLKSQQDGVTWKFITVPEPIQNIGVLAAADRFEGYAAERTEILKFIDDNKISNVVFVSADIHGTLVNNLTYQTAPGQAQIATSAFEITTGSVGYSQPFGQTVAQLGAALGVITPAQKAFYDAQNAAGKDAFIKGVVDAGLQPLGYDPLGLDKNLTQANGLINAKLLQGDYVATHVYGWTDFNIDQQTQKLTVTTYGIDSYTRTELEANPSAITSRQPRIVSQFEVVPTVADLELTQTVDKTNVEVGDRVTFTLTISNKGAVLANGIQVTDLLPSELSFIAATPAQGAYDSSTGRWTVGEIATNASTTLQITARVDRNGAVVNKAEVTALNQADSDSTVGNNNAAEDDQATISFSPKALVTGTSGIDDLVAGVTPGFDGVNDLLFTGSGNDTVDIALASTATGNNRVDLGSGNDLIFIADADRVFGSNGSDELDATDAKNYRVSGGAGDDTLFLGANGRALGGDGNDRFFVGAGGGNLLTGGAGVDQFVITTGDIPTAPNTILDFQIGTDVIGIQGIGANATNIVLAQVGADTSIAFEGQALALLKGIQANSLTLSNANQFAFT